MENSCSGLHSAEKLWGSYGGLQQTDHKSKNSCSLKKKNNILVLFYRVQQEYNLLVEWNSSASVSIGLSILRKIWTNWRVHLESARRWFWFPRALQKLQNSFVFSKHQELHSLWQKWGEVTEHFWKLECFIIQGFKWRLSGFSPSMIKLQETMKAQS